MQYEGMLTKGALKSIKNSEYVEDPVLQVINIGKVSGINELYNLIVSDGENINSVGMAINLNNMLSSGKLNKFSLIKIRNYVTTNVVEPAKEPRQVIIVSDLVVIVPGSIICRTIGNPQAMRNKIEPILRMEASTSKALVNEVFDESHTKQEIVWRSLIEGGLYSRLLTEGALQSIMNNVNVEYPVMQVLKIKRLMDTASIDCRYRLIISDGQQFYSLVMLSNRLNNFIDGGHLTEFSIIYIKSYVVADVTHRSRKNKQVIVLKDLVCLFVCPGEIIGDPKPATGNSDQAVECGIPAVTGAIPEPIVEMDTSSPSAAQGHELDNLLLNLDMLHLY